MDLTCWMMLLLWWIISSHVAKVWFSIIIIFIWTWRPLAFITLDRCFCNKTHVPSKFYFILISRRPVSINISWHNGNQTFLTCYQLLSFASIVWRIFYLRFMRGFNQKFYGKMVTKTTFITNYLGFTWFWNFLGLWGVTWNTGSVCRSIFLGKLLRIILTRFLKSIMIRFMNGILGMSILHGQ